MALLTLGLGRRAPAAFQQTLEAIHADAVVDIRLVRESPVHAYEEESVRALVEAAGLPYLHRPGLGERTLNGRRLIRDARELAMLCQALDAGKTILLVCSCESPARCHRTAIADLVGGEVRHL